LSSDVSHGHHSTFIKGAYKAAAFTAKKVRFFSVRLKQNEAIAPGCGM
jgi:hypothetical protein